MSGDKCFFDTNIIVYAQDHDLPDKQAQAASLFRARAAQHCAVVSYQVIQEYLNTVTRKFARRVRPADAVEFARDILWPVCAIMPSASLFERATGLHEGAAFSFYDSLIVAAALEADCTTLYSEDLQHQQRIETLTVVNPFLPPVRPAAHRSRRKSP